MTSNDFADDKSAGNGSGSDMPVPAGKSCELLLIEDDSDLATVMIQSMSGLSVRITHMEGQVEGLQSIQESEPDLLILDLGLPDGDGHELVAQLRQLGLSKLPLIVYTVSDLSDKNKRDLKLGETHYLTKSHTSLGQLRAIVTDFIASAA